ncbi:MAG TPA: transporter [Planctomycetota bacterium]|nr:transporter [Planctomycetota bacterium]
MFLRVGACACLAAALPAQLFTTDAGVISPELPQVRERVEWLPRARSDEWRAESRLSWSPDRLVQLDLTVPLVTRRVEVLNGAGALHGKQEGLGDMTLATKWALVRADDVMRSDRFSLLVDVQLPTGDDDTHIDGADAGRRAALGLGTFGAAAGLGYTLVRDRHRAAAALRYWQFETDAGFAPGEAVQLDLAWWYRLSPTEFGARLDVPEYRLTAELLSRWQADDRLSGASAGNGGYEYAAVLGMQCNLTPASAIEGGVIVPFAHTTESPFGDARVGFTMSFRLAF